MPASGATGGMAYCTRPMAEGDGQSRFRSGNGVLDSWFRKHAWHNELHGLSRTYVLEGEIGGRPAIVGFYCVSMAQVDPAQLPGAENGPHYPWPMAKIGRLARHARAMGSGTGPRLLTDALLRCLEVADSVGCAGILVDAKAEGSLAFYCRYGFSPLESNPDRPWPRTLFLPMATLRDSVALGSDAPG